MATSSSSTGVALAGLASGFDWQSLVTQLVAAERKAEEPYTKQKTDLSSQLEGLTTLKTDMKALQDAAATLKKGTSDYYSRTVTMGKNTSTTTSNLSGTADGTTPLGSYTFNVTTLATSTQTAGAKISATLNDTSKTLANLNVATGITAGTFTVAGKTITVATTDTLQSVFDQISSQTGGEVTAALSSNRIVLTGHDIGNGQPRLTLGSAADSSNFLNAMQLFSDTSVTPAASVQSASDISSANVSTALNNSINTGALTNLTDGKGSFTINGKTISFSTTGSSIRSIMSDINISGAGVLANYDPGSGKITLTNQQTGTLGIALSDNTGILTQLGLTSGAGATTTYGVNAQFSVNGGATITSNSNTLTSAVTGIPGLKVTATATGSDKVTVAADTTKAKANIQTFVDAYNKLNTDMSSLTKTTLSADGASVTTSALSANHEVQGWLTSIRQMLFGAVDTGVSTVSHLYNIGLDFSSTDGSLSITDSAQLDEALAENPEAVAKIFNKSNSAVGVEDGGLGNRVYNFIQKLVKFNGAFDTQTTSINNRTKSITDQISRMEDKILNDQERLTASFQKMEDAMSQINQQTSMITGLSNLSWSSS